MRRVCVKIIVANLDKKTVQGISSFLFLSWWFFLEEKPPLFMRSKHLVHDFPQTLQFSYRKGDRMNFSFSLCISLSLPLSLFIFPHRQFDERRLLKEQKPPFTDFQSQGCDAVDTLPHAHVVYIHPKSSHGVYTPYSPHTYPLWKPFFLWCSSTRANLSFLSPSLSALSG